jgi:hypothetical protein
VSFAPARLLPIAAALALSIAAVAAPKYRAPQEKARAAESPCKRRRATRQPICSGVPPMGNRPNTVEVVACDGCTSDRDCTAHPKGRCVIIGGGACRPAAAYVCRYPKDVCFDCPSCTNDGQGHAACQRVPPSMPPSAPKR